MTDITNPDARTARFKQFVINHFEAFAETADRDVAGTKRKVADMPSSYRGVAAEELGHWPASN